MSDAKLKIEGLTKRFGDETAVDDLSFNINDGQFKGLLGPSGCGKTTTLRCIAGLEHPDEGRISLDGNLIVAPNENVNVPPVGRGIGMVFQSYAIWPHMTVEENIRYPLDVQGIGSKAERQDRVESMLRTVGLDAYHENLSTNLSGGQQQRVALARALINEPKLVLFDEPLSNLDAKLRRQMRKEIKQICNKIGSTVLYVTHSQDEAMYLSDELAIMNNGKIVEEGRPSSIYSKPKTFFNMNFMGQSNTIEGAVKSSDSDRLFVETAYGELDIPNSNDEFSRGENVLLCFRPKFCSIDPLKDGTSENVTLDGTLTGRSMTRDYIEYRVEVQHTEITVRTLNEQPVRSGDAVQIVIDPNNIEVFSEDREELLT